MRRPLPARQPLPKRYLIAIVAVALCCGCATAGAVPDRVAIDAAIRERAHHGIRLNDTDALPPDVVVGDGLTPSEAVALALWNNPAFQLALADLGFARADLIEARQLRNPVLSLLFPWGPKQLESTLQMPIDAIWQRPRRVKSARLDAEAIAARLMSDGLGVIAQARTAYLDASASDARLQLAQESADLWARLRTISDARLREGDISELEARSVRSEAAIAVASVLSAEGDKERARILLDAVVGLEVPAASALTPVDDLPLPSCGPVESLLADALASRPDVRAAELAVEAAGARVGLERSRILALTATLDANGEGKEGFELGPGVGIDLPLNGNAGGRARAAAGLNQASRRYLAVQAAVRAELRTGVAQLEKARKVLQVWDEQVIDSVQVQRQQAEKAYEAGETPLYTVLDVGRRLVSARRARLDARVELLAAAVALDRAIGRTCSFQ